MQTWLYLSLAALLCWGAWGLFANLAARHVDGFSAVVWEVAGAMVVGGLVLVWLLRGSGVALKRGGVVFGVATGIAYTAGLVFLFLALGLVARQGGLDTPGANVHTILVLTALYPVVAVMLNYLILAEPLTARQIIGIAVGLCGIVILTSG
jgi:bacterial/archaeal transporter family protein